MFLGTLSSNVGAGVFIVNPSKDNSMFAENGDLSGGNGGLFAGVTFGLENTTLRRALMHFDLPTSIIPVGSTINSVSLRLSVQLAAAPNSGADVLLLHRRSADWGETTLLPSVGKGTVAQPNDATWRDNFYNTSSWVTPGGDFTAAPSGTITLDTISFDYTFSAQAGLVADVQNWVNNPSTNFGWLMKYENEDDIGTARNFFFA